MATKEKTISRNKLVNQLGVESDPPVGHTVESWLQHCERMFDEADAEEKEKENGKKL
jgi:hypothetical protein